MLAVVVVHYTQLHQQEARVAAVLVLNIRLAV
jgi:hypothetical protein